LILQCTYEKTEEVCPREKLFEVLEQKLATYYEDLLTGKVDYKEQKANALKLA